MRLIDADKLPWRREYVSDDNMMTEHVVSKGDVDVMPTIDPVKHGHWIEDRIGDEHWLCYDCSECGNMETVKSNYCPWCGAKMIDEEIE